MYFIGQKTIMNQLSLYLPKLHQDKELSMSFILRAPSGWGKTRMAFMMCNYLTGGNFLYYLADSIGIPFGKRVVFIDEIHLLKTPEILYPHIDSGKHVFIFATNEVSVLAEALVNRCTNLVFEEYNVDELRDIASSSLIHKLSNECLDYIIESSANNPRIIRGNCSKLNMINPEKLKEIQINEFKTLMSDIFGIRDGMDVLCQRYMDVLKSLGGTASLQTISSSMRLDEGSVRFHIEPILLYKNLIRISNKGRSIN